MRTSAIELSVDLNVNLVILRCNSTVLQPPCNETRLNIRVSSKQYYLYTCYYYYSCTCVSLFRSLCISTFHFSIHMCVVLEIMRPTAVDGNFVSDSTPLISLCI